MLKISQVFVENITIDSEDVAIAKSIIQVAQSLDLDVIAEGVETTEHLKILRTLQCNKIQGYLFSRPLPAEEVVEFLKKGWCFLVDKESLEMQKGQTIL